MFKVNKMTLNIFQVSIVDFELVNAGWLLLARFPNKPLYSFIIDKKQLIY